MEPEYPESVAPKFLENLRRDFSEGNEESFHKADPLLIQEEQQAQEQLILKVSFFVVYILLEERKKKACEMINGYVSKPKKRRDKNIGLKSSQKVSLYTITRKTEYYYKIIKKCRI